MKKCTQCKQFKNESEFGKNRYKKDGLATECKECTRYNALRYAHSIHGKIIRKLYNQTQEAKDTKRRYEQSPKGQENKRMNRDKFPDRRKARRAINNAIRDGRFPSAKIQRCYTCGKPAQEYHHHLGYAHENWMNVIPLCKSCHVIADKDADQ